MVLKSHIKEKLWDDYGGWLIERVGFRRRRYDRLLETLHNIPFRYSIPLDENRAYDGIALRDDFALYLDCLEVRFDRPCSVLEMLVALSIRIEYEYIGDPKQEHPERIFFEMLENLFDMNQYEKYCSDSYFSQSFVENKVEKWLNRDFHPSGYGSIFPLKDPSRDQRYIEIWAQMNEYLMENYPI